MLTPSTYGVALVVIVVSSSVRELPVLLVVPLSIASTMAAASPNETAAPVGTTTVVLKISGHPDSGEVGCALYRGPQGFPTGAAAAIASQWHPAGPSPVVCLFEDLAPGTYAATASHDGNANRKVDTGLFGIPKEAWGVSGGVRPRLRAPRFDEARFEAAIGETRLVLVIE